MKKTLSILLAVVLMFALALPVFAEPSEVSVPSNTTHDVTAKYEAGTEDGTVATVYLVTVDWATVSTLTYSDGTTTYKWNANSTQYEAQDPEDAGWKGDAKVTVTVTNKSNAAITAKAEWASASTLTAACDFSGKESIEVASAATGTDLVSSDKVLKGEPKTGTIQGTVTVSGGTINQDNAVVGTITLSIAAKQ